MEGGRIVAAKTQKRVERVSRGRYHYDAYSGKEEKHETWNQEVFLL